MFHRLVHLSGGAGILVGLSLLFCLPFHLVWFAVPPNAQAQLDRGLRITELQYDPPGLDEEREWVELANLGEETLTLVGYGLGDAAQRGSREGMLRFPAGITAGPGQTIIVARTALGFRALFGFNPDLELQETDTAVPNMLADTEWATGQFALANDGDDLLLLDPDGLLVDGLNYGDRDTLFSPSVPLAVVGQSLQRVPAGCDTDSALEWQALSPPTPGTLPVGADCPSLPETLGAEKQDLLRIGEIQGKGDTSPFLNQQVAFSGIVTGVLEDQNAAGIIYYTLFIQDATGEVDGDPDSSDGIAVFYGRNRPPYANGDLVEVRGRVTEYYGLTEIEDDDLAITRLATGQHLPPAQELQLPQTAAEANAYLEAREGMLVALPSPLPVVGPTHSGCGFAVAAQSGQARPIRSATDSELNSVVLILHHSDVDCSQLPALKFGDEVDGISGPLTYHFERYKVVQQDVASLVVQPGAAELLDPLPAHAADLLRAATFNLNNYLRPAETMGDELDGRPSAEALAAKRYKTAATISTALGCPELLAVQEVETVELLGELAADLANACGFTYSVAHRDSPDARGIDVALMVDPRRATILSTMLRQTCTPLDTGILDAAANCSPGQYPLFSRPPLEVGLRIDGERFRVLVNHFKSKREGEAETAPRRLAQANYVHGLVKSWLEMDPSAAILVVGDFNDYEQSVVWLRLQEEGILVNALQRVPQEHRYSYIFDGESQLLDGVFVSPALVHRIATAEIRHTNSDYPWSLAADVSTFYGASDHDVPLVAFHAAATMPGQTPLPVTGPVAPAAATGSLSVMATPVFEVQERAAPSPDAAVQTAENSPLEHQSMDTGWPARYLPLGLLLLALLVGCAYVLLRRH